jgi:hypothetical protein
MLSRWSIGAYGSLANVNSMVPDMAPGKATIDLAEIFKPSSIYDATWDNLALNWGILGAHTLAYVLIAFFLQKRKDIF